MLIEHKNLSVWVTWLTKLLTGENSCEWAAWFRTHVRSYRKVPNDFNALKWQLEHTNALNALLKRIEAPGRSAFIEDQNHFTLRGSTAALSGKPDLVAYSGTTGAIYDVKTGRSSPSHVMQVMIYMYALPRATKRYQGMSFEGIVAYADHQVRIPNSAIDGMFVAHLSQLVRRIADDAPARRVPSQRECRFCPITTIDCPDRATSEVSAIGWTQDF